MDSLTIPPSVANVCQENFFSRNLSEKQTNKPTKLPPEVFGKGNNNQWCICVPFILVFVPVCLKSLWFLQLQNFLANVCVRVCARAHACLPLQVVQPVMWRGAVFAKGPDLMLHSGQCTSHQVGETVAPEPSHTCPRPSIRLSPPPSLLCDSSVCLAIKNRNTLPLFDTTPVGTLSTWKACGFEGDSSTEPVCVRTHSENNLELKYPACLPPWQFRGEAWFSTSPCKHTPRGVGLHLEGNQDTPTLFFSFLSPQRLPTLKGSGGV